MKKVLFATTALVASAGIASAQGVAISGSAEIGVVGGDRYAETQFFQSVDVRFAMSGETNSGLTFGATVDARDLVDMGQAGQDGTDIANGAFADFTVFIAGDFGRVTMGDTDGALDWAMQEAVFGPGSIDDSQEHPGFNGNSGLDGLFNFHDGQVVRYDHSFGNFAFALSVEMDDTGIDDPVFGVGVKYSASLGSVDLGIGLGYQTTSQGDLNDASGANFVDDFDIIGVSLDAQFAGGFRVVANYSDYSMPAGFIGPDSHWGIGAGYEWDAISVAASYGVFSGDNGFADTEGFGLAVNYDLGGGAVVQFGYGTGKTDDGTFTNTQGASTDSYSLGIAMSF